MNTLFIFVFLVNILVVCVDEGAVIEPTVEVPNRMYTISYPYNVGTLGNSATGILGYDLDVTGLGDTVSVHEKIFRKLTENVSIYHSSGTLLKFFQRPTLKS